MTTEEGIIPLKIPATEGPGYKIVGMGQVMYFKEFGKQLRWLGASMDYDQSFNKEHLDELIEKGLLEGWEHISK